VGRARRLGEVGGGRPAAEQLERLFGARTGLGGVGEDRQPVVGGEVQPVVAQAELADCGMVEPLDTWLLAQGADIAPIPGTKRVSRVEENMAADAIELSVEQIARLNDLTPAAGERHEEASMATIER
jgi:hypothetical protein